MARCFKHFFVFKCANVHQKLMTVIVLKLTKPAMSFIYFFC